MAKKASKKSAARAKPPAPATGDSVAIRMYRGLLGDCFLLTHVAEGETYRALIDCGVLQRIGPLEKKPRTQVALDHMSRVVANLFEDTGGKLDLVVGTHEHYDHLSGFIREFRTWEKFEIGEVWLAWTENYSDDLANAIREKRSKGLVALNALAGPSADASRFGLDATDDDTAESLRRVGDLLQFYGEIEEMGDYVGQGMAAAPAQPRAPKVPPKSCLDVFDWLKSKAANGNVRYLDPGQQLMFGAGKRLKASVFGPPRERKFLLDLNPDPNKDEVYLAARDEIVSLETTMHLQKADPAREGVAAHVTAYPFADRFRRWEEEGSEDAIAAIYYSAGAKSRRIDGDWLGSAETLALKIDSDVNNTSLVLAIEVPGTSRDVLLFAADAQVGNWISWHEQKYPAKPKKPDTIRETAEQILNRVIFYKVGHHASHNATHKAKGLEMMVSPDLVAMIPVVTAVANEQATRNNPEGWAMPYDKLYASLQQKTRGRVVKGDGIRADETAAFDKAGGRFTLAYADESDDPLWVEFRMNCGG